LAHHKKFKHLIQRIKLQAKVVLDQNSNIVENDDIEEGMPKTSKNSSKELFLSQLIESTNV